MAQAFPFWVARFLLPARLLAHPRPSKREPLKIEVDPLPDYRWRDLGFQQPARGRGE